MYLMSKCSIYAGDLFNIISFFMSLSSFFNNVWLFLEIIYLSYVLFFRCSYGQHVSAQLLLACDCHTLQLASHHNIPIITLPSCALSTPAVVSRCCCCCCCCRPHSTNVLPAESSTRNHVAASSLSPQVARKGSTLSGFVQRSRREREVGRDLHSNKWEEV